MNVLELRRDRKRLVDQAAEILNKSQTAKRSMTAAETDEFDRLHQRAAELTARIDRMDTQEEAERRQVESVIRRRTATASERSTLDVGSDAVLGADETFESRARAEGDVETAEEREFFRRALGSEGAAAGGITVPTMTAARIQDAMMERLTFASAGAQRIRLSGGDNMVPRQASNAATAWVGENTQLSDTDVTFDGISAKPHMLAIGPVKLPRKLVDTSAVDITGWVERHLAERAARELERAAIYGLGTALEPAGIIYAGINEHDMGTNGSAFTDWTPFITAQKLIREDNGPDPMHAIMAPRTAAELASLATATELLPLPRPDDIAKIQFHTTTTVATDETQGSATDASRVLLGGFESMGIALWGDGLKVMVLRERYADYLQVGVILYCLADIVVFEPDAIASITGIIPA